MKEVVFIDYVVIVFYFALMLGIGLFFMRKFKGANDYFAGGNKIPWWTSGVSLYMTNFSAWIFSGAAGFVYATGYFALIYLGLGALAYYLGAKLTARRWRRSRVISPVEYTNTRFNLSTQQLFGIIIGMVFILSAGVQIAAIGILLSAPLGINISVVIGGVGLIVLVYTFFGGLWAVNITDFVQFVILLATALVILPLSIQLVDGLPNLLANIQPLTFDHVYNNIHYDGHYLVAILMVTTIGVAGGAAQRFYSVKDEASAMKVGRMAGVLFLTFPLVFGVPPLVASVLWPDLSVVEFFMGREQPTDLVFLAVAMQVLPSGLIGLFMAALFAATMSALSSVYNMVSAIIARDMYKDAFHPEAPDKRVFLVGRLATIVMGLIVIGLGLMFVHSELGIFNIMMVFFVLFNAPMGIPMAFGLIFKHVPRWSAFGTIIWGFYLGLIARFILNWGFGAQIYMVMGTCFLLFVGSGYLGRLYKTNKPFLAAIFAGTVLMLGVIWYNHVYTDYGDIMYLILPVLVVVGFAQLWLFAYLFARESEADRAQVEGFFNRLYTPVDVAKEVFARGGKITSSFGMVGTLTMIVGAFIFVVHLVPVAGTASQTYIVLSSILFSFGFLMYFFGRRSERREMARYRAEIEERGLEVVEEPEPLVP